MKLKVLAVLVLGAVSINAFAYRMIDEKSTCKGFAECHTVDKKIQSSNQKKSYMFYVTAHAHPAEGKVNEYIQLSGDHSVNITNGTSKKQTYEYIFDLTCMDANYHYVRHVELDPSEDFVIEAESTGVIQRQEAGGWHIYATTTVDGPRKETITGQAILTVKK